MHSYRVRGTSQLGVVLAAVSALLIAVSCSDQSPRNPDPLTARLAAHCGVSSASFEYTGSVPTFGPFDIRDWWSANGRYKIELTRATDGPDGPGPWRVSCNGGAQEPFTVPVGQDPANASG